MEHSRFRRRGSRAAASVPANNASPTNEPGEATTGQATRLRRAHKKSRNGCSNCKMRSVKCDESKPSCKRCQAYRVTCSYVHTQRTAAKDLSYPGEMSFDISTTTQPTGASTPSPGKDTGRQASTTSISTSSVSSSSSSSTSSSSSSPNDEPIVKHEDVTTTTASSITTTSSGFNADSDSQTIKLYSPSAQPQAKTWAILPLAEPDPQQSSYQLQNQYLDLYDRFVSRTMHTLITTQTKEWYNRKFVTVIKGNPALLHMCFALTILHDTHLSASPPSPWLQSALSFHWYHGAALFLRQLKSTTTTTKALSSSISNSVLRIAFPDDEALWMASVLLGVSAMSNIDTLGPSAAWPLKEPGPLDLDWLKLIYGKRAVWEVVDIHQPNTIFSIIQTQNWWKKDYTFKAIRPDSLPEAFIDLFNLSSSSSSSADTNPYYNAAAVLSQILPIGTGQPNLFPWRFISAIDPPLRILLETRDTRAMLLLLYWYGKVAPMPQWWVRRRAVVEGLALWEHLRRQCEGDEVVMPLLEWPVQRLREVAVEDELMSACASFVNMTIGACGSCVVS